MTQLTNENFRQAISKVNQIGYAAIDLSSELPPELGVDLYAKMDATTFHPSRERYYNEVAFYWPEDWRDVERGICSFHRETSLKHIYSHTEALQKLETHLGEKQAQAVVDFAKKIKELTIANHFGLPDNELRLARVMIRQMNEHDHTKHSGSEYHEDVGYDDGTYQQLLSVIITTYGVPTVAQTYTPKVGELLLFNAFDRRRILEMGEERAFIHKGPKNGPKMFFFFEFLGPRKF